jgi:hypothetical protein
MEDSGRVFAANTLLLFGLEEIHNAPMCTAPMCTADQNRREHKQPETPSGQRLLR